MISLVRQGLEPILAFRYPSPSTTTVMNRIYYSSTTLAQRDFFIALSFDFTF